MTIDNLRGSSVIYHQKYKRTCAAAVATPNTKSFGKSAFLMNSSLASLKSGRAVTFIKTIIIQFDGLKMKKS